MLQILRSSGVRLAYAGTHTPWLIDLNAVAEAFCNN
jgi:hypothetical protein